MSCKHLASYNRALWLAIIISVYFDLSHLWMTIITDRLNGYPHCSYVSTQVTYYNS